MAIAIVNEDHNISFGGDAIATTDFSSTAITAGNSLLVLCRWRTDSDATAISSVTVTDNSNMTLSVSRVPIHATGLSGASHAWAYLSNITSSGVKTITATLDGTPTTGFLHAWELSGCDTAGMLGATESTEGDGVEVEGSLTTTRANSAIFAAYGNDGTSQAPGTGWTDIAFTNLFWFSDGEYDVSSDFFFSFSFSDNLFFTSVSVKG